MNIYPNAYLKSVQQITIQFLEEHKIKALILDVDNTLIDYYKNLSNNVIEWAEELKRQGIPLAEDTEDRSNIIFSGAESILYGCNPNDITEVVEEIKQWISETKSNYPNYFITGECQ